MSLRLRLFLGLGSLVAVLVLTQWWWIHGLTRDLTEEVDTIAVTVGNSLAAHLVMKTGEPCPEGETCEQELVLQPAAQLLQPVAQHHEELVAAPSERRVEVHAVATEDGDDEMTVFVNGRQLTPDEIAELRQSRPREAYRFLIEEEDGGTAARDWSFLHLQDDAPARYLTFVGKSHDDLRRIRLPNEGLNEKLERFRRKLLLGSFALLGFGLLLAAVVAQRVSMRRAREHLGEIGEISRGLAHALRNPLNALGLSVEELASQAPPEAAGLAESARRQIRRIDQSIRSFLALASQGGGVVDLVDVGGLVQDVALEVLQQSSLEDVRLEVDTAAAPSVRAVAPELRAVVQALVVNAVEASPRGGTVTVRVMETGAERARVEITDQGPGLPDEVRERLFTPHLTTKATGSGMGLFLAHRISTTRYDGTLVLDPVEGGPGTRAALEIGPRREDLDDA